VASFQPTIRRVSLRRPRSAPATAEVAETVVETVQPATFDDQLLPLDIAANDPIVAYLESATGAVELATLDLDSPALAELRLSGITLVVPLVSNGELIGLLHVGRRRSDQDYSADDRRLLETLAAQAAPAVRVGQLVREQQVEMQARGRLEQELAVAQLIQQNFRRRSCRSLRAGRSPPTTGRPVRSVATSTTSSSYPTVATASSSAMSPTRASRRQW